MRPIRTPLTIVGIVSNVVALVLVTVVLYSDPQSKLPTVKRLAVAIEQIAKTKRVTLDDITKLLGRPTMRGRTMVYWYESIPIHSEEKTFVRALTVKYDGEDEKEGTYRLKIISKCTYKSGLRYLYNNMMRAIGGDTLFPLRQYEDREEEILTLSAPK